VLCKFTCSFQNYKLVCIIILSNITTEIKFNDQLKNNNNEGGEEKKIENIHNFFKINNKKQ